jgi:GMP synthase (glutamine-hydrolysing)
MKPFLVLQFRPETEAADDEFEAILDKGRLSGEEVRRIRLDAEPLPPGFDLADYTAVIAGGGPPCVSDPPEAKSPLEARMEEQALALMPAITEGDVPFMGCCYGISVLVHHLGGEVSKARWSEPVGPTACVRTDEGRRDALLADLPDRFAILVGHKEAVQHLPEDCVHLLEGDACPVQMVRYRENVYATQFHPEADAEVFALRIGVYKHRGYFEPDRADSLIAACRAVEVTVPPRILRGFVDRYRHR